MIITIRELALLIGTLTQEPSISIDAPNLACLARNIYHEARDQSAEGMVAVAYVTIQRLKSGRWGSTLCQVVEAPSQFSWHSDGLPDAPTDLQAYKAALTAAVLALTGRAEDASNGASHYYAPGLASPVWAASMIVSATLRGHTFLTDCKNPEPAPICAPVPPLKPRSNKI